MRSSTQASRPGVFSPAISVPILLAAAAPGLAADLDASLGLRERLLEDAAARDVLNAGSQALTITPSAMIQFRYVLDSQDQQDSQEDLTLGFENTRTRIGLKGAMPDQKLSFFIWHGFTGTGASLLLDAWTKWEVSDNLALRIGQFKLPVWQEWTVSETRLTGVERSVLDARFAQLYSQGVEATYTQDRVRLIAAFSDGLRSWNDSSLGHQAGLSARVEALFRGAWSQRDDFQSFRDEDELLVVGLAAHTQDGGTLTGAGGSSIYTNDTRITQFTADAQWGFGGWSLFAAVIANNEERPGGTEYDQLGAMIQAQAFVTDRTEIFARYEWGDLDGQAADFATANPGATDNDELSIFTVGVNHFIAGHAMKLTADAGFATDEVSGAWGGSGRGWRGDDADAGTQFVIRAQLQALF